MARTRRLLMGITASAALAVGVVLPTTAAQAATPYIADPASVVDPIIGTSGAVDDFPGADVPFGMVQWSPDTPSRPAGGGYEYNDKAVTGFSLTHISGPRLRAPPATSRSCPTSGAIASRPRRRDAAARPQQGDRAGRAVHAHRRRHHHRADHDHPQRAWPLHLPDGRSRRTCCSSCPTARPAPTRRTSRSSTTRGRPAGSPAATSAARTTATRCTST